MRLLKSVCFGALLASSSVLANTVEVIKITEGAGSSNQSYDLVLVVQQLQAEMRQLRGLVESQKYELDELKYRQKQMYSEFDQRLGGSYSPGASGSAADLPAAVLSGNEQQDYSAAFAYVKSQELAKAEAAFKEYMKIHPKSARLSNALYWLGEVSLAQGKLPAAADYFQQLIAEHGKSAKVPDALYKLGRTYQRMGKAADAIATWQQLVQQYPKAAAAKLARNALK
ncbi:tol-pal system protein YbgF ['Osedax' symbiont bacterium Rs2_46_30_T18]|nr:tol-pal system protein YbgF ['Osedax' symbiont bacterium Rs2_46_30_T18]